MPERLRTLDHGAMIGSLPRGCHRAGTCRGSGASSTRSRSRTVCALIRASARCRRPGSCRRRACGGGSPCSAVQSCCSILPAYLFSCGGVGKPPFSRAGRAGGLTCGATMARLGPRYGSGRFSLRATSSRVEGDGLAGTGAAPMVSFPRVCSAQFFRFGSQQSQPPYRKRIAANAGRPSAKVPPDPLRQTPHERIRVP